ncbi:unnamed protein product [Mytilus coruscus]|uniref:Uncharacterized protein n=1 Tax=Mytilus coruscus TaxID=42192 RepID=A0A6J8A0D0_MYTCO|nr:unnamed protein product [Mytilus coruscus]
MYTKVLTIISLIVTKHAKGQDASSCEFPCEFRGHTFDFYLGEKQIGIWMFNNDGITSSFTLIFGSGVESTNVLTCYQRVDRFIIFRMNEDDKFICFFFDYSPGMLPISFSFGLGAVFTSVMPDPCILCDTGGFDSYLAIESGGTTPSDTVSLPLCTVSGCPGTNLCGANDTLPEGCPPSTTTITTTTEETIQPTKRCHKRRHRH